MVKIGSNAAKQSRSKGSGVILCFRNVYFLGFYRNGFLGKVRRFFCATGAGNDNRPAFSLWVNDMLRFVDAIITENGVCFHASSPTPPRTNQTIANGDKVSIGDKGTPKA